MNLKKVLKAIILSVIIFVLCIFTLIFFIAWDDARELRSTGVQTIDYGEYTRYVDITDVVKEAFVTDNGYTDELSRYMMEMVFKRTNYKSYNVDDPEYTKPFKVDLTLKEVYQTKDKDYNLIYVDMIYTLAITDANGKIVGASEDTPVTFTVRIDENQWYIIDKYERL